MANSCVPRHIIDKQIKRIATLLKNAVVVEIDKVKKTGVELDPGEIVASIRSNILDMPGREWLAPLIDEAIEMAWPGDNFVSYSYHHAITDMNFKPITVATFTADEFVSRVDELKETEGFEETKEYGEDLVGYSSQKFGDTGMDAFDVNFDMVIGKRISDKDRRLNETRAREFDSFDDYLDWVKDYFGLETIYDVHIPMFYDKAHKDDTGDNRDVWVVPTLEDAQLQLDSIKAGLGGGKNFANKITRYGDHYIILHDKGDHKHIYLEGSEPTTLKPDKKREPGKSYKKEMTLTQKTNLLIYWNTHNAKNSMEFEKRMQYVWTNMDPNMAMEDMEDIVNAIVIDGDKGIIGKPNFSLNNGRKEPRFLAKNYIDNLKRTIREKQVGRMTQYHPMKEAGTMIPKKDGSWWMKPDQNRFSRKDLLRFEYDLSQNTKGGTPAPMVMVGMTPGDTGTIITTLVHPDHVKDLFDPKEALNTMINLGFPDKIINEFKAHIAKGGSVAKYLMKMDKEQQEFDKARRVSEVKYSEDAIEQMDELRTKIKDMDGVEGMEAELKEAKMLLKTLRKTGKKTKAPKITPIVAARIQQNKAFHAAMWGHGASKLQEYLQIEVNDGNMTAEDAKKIYDDAITSMAKTNMGELVTPYTVHLGGVIARIEWLKAVRGDDFMQYGAEKDGIKKGANAFNVFDRLRIALTKGISLSEISDRRTFIIDNNRVEYWLDGEKLDHGHLTEKLTEIENIFDGGSMSGTESLDLIAEKNGSQKIKGKDHNLREIKTTEFHVGEEGMFEKKHALFAAIAGLEIREIGKKGEQGDLIVQVKEEDGHIRMKDINGRIVHQISDMDATKTATGEYNLLPKEGKDGKVRQSKAPYVEAMLSMDDFKIVISPHPKSSETTYGAVQYLSNLNFDLNELTPEERTSLEKYQKVMEDMIGEQSDIYIELLLEASSNPSVLWDIIKHSYSDKAEAKHALKSILSTTGGAGLYHPNNLSMIKPLILNMLVKRGSMQARTTDDRLINKITNPVLKKKLQKMAKHGSHYILKPGRRVEKGSVILSADNHVIFDQIVKKIYDTGYWKAWRLATAQVTGDNTAPTFDQLSDEKKAEVMSAFLEEFPQHVLTYRSPIGQSAAVEPRRIQAFTYDEGNAIYHHPDDTFDRLVGDHDIDEAGVVMITDKQLKDIQEFQNTDLYKQFQSLNADISIFKRGESKHVGSIEDTRDTILALLNATHVQGQAVNAKTVASALSTKFEEIELSTGLKLKPKKLFSHKKKHKVIMNYAPLREGFNPKDLPPHARAVGYNKKVRKWEDWTPAHGNMYIETSAEHEFLLIMNAAVDVGKDGMMMNMWGASAENWFIDRMFTFNKKAPDKLEYKAIKEILRKFKNSSLRKLRTDKTQKPMDMGLLFYILGEKRKLLNLNSSQLADYIKKMPEVSYSQGEGENPTKKMGVTVKNVIMVNDARINELKSQEKLTKAEKNELKKLEEGTVETLEEKFIMRLYDKFQEKFPQGEGQLVEAPLIFNPDRQDIAHSYARNELHAEIKRRTDDGEISVEEIEEGTKLAEKFADEFYPNIEDLEPANDSDDTKEEARERYIKTKQVEFDEILYDLTEKYNKEIAKLESEYGDAVRTIFTDKMLFGVGDKKKIRYIPPVELLSPDLVRQYFESWDNHFLDKSISKGVLDQSQYAYDELIKIAREKC
jgi:hypothetical protein